VNVKPSSEVVATIRIQLLLKLFRLENGTRTFLYSEACEKISNFQTHCLNTGYYQAIS
jgi:hypothetical protein